MGDESPLDLYHLRKLSEEAAGLVAALESGCDRGTLSDKIADMLAVAELTCDHFDLWSGALHIRRERRKSAERAWHQTLTAEDDE